MITDTDIKKLKSVFATKKDLKGFAKKVDLKNFATKDDLNRFATKDDLKNFVTKQDLIGLAKASELEDLKIMFIDKLAEWKSELFTKIDAVLVRLKTAEEEKTILEARAEGRQHKAPQIEIRIKHLEDLHPGGAHHS